MGYLPRILLRNIGVLANCVYKPDVIINIKNEEGA